MDRGKETEINLTEEVLALFPASHLPNNVKDAIRQKGIIPNLTRWMRNLSDTYWGGFCNTSDLDFWQAHQWNGSQSEFWVGSNLTTPAQWTGQPNRLNEQPLFLPHQKNVWFRTTRYDVLVDGGFSTSQLEAGMVFNHMTNTEWFVNTGKVMSYGYEQSPVQIEGRPYVDFKPALHPQAFTPYSVSLDMITWVGFQLKGPGYVVDFTGVVDTFSKNNSDGSLNIYHAAVYGEEMADAVTNQELEMLFRQIL